MIDREWRAIEGMNGRWWFRLWLNAKANHRPPRAAVVEWPYIWAAHLLAWAIGMYATRGRKGGG